MIMKREKVNVVWTVFLTKCKIGNLFDIIIKIVKNAALHIVKEIILA